MAIDTITYAAAKKYTDKTVAGGGAIAGKNCVIESIIDITGGHRVNFKWTLDNGTVQTAYMDVMDGEDGKDGLGIKSVDVDSSNHLIITYDDDTTHDAGEIESEGQIIQRNVLPTASISELYNIYQYIGVSGVDYINGYFYQCVEDGSGYKWEQKNVQPAGSSETIDPALDPTSHNPVENMAIAVPINALQGSMTNMRLDIDELFGSMANFELAIHDLDLLVASKVDKVVGKGLSTNDFTDAEKQKLGNLQEIYLIGSGLSLEGSVLRATGMSTPIDTELDKTSTNPVQNKAIALAFEDLQGSMANKVDKVDGKGLSTNDFTDENKEKLIQLKNIYLIGSGLSLNPTTHELSATGMAITIDDHLDKTSTHPVQNGAIALAFEQLQGSMANKVDKVDGKGLSTNDYDNASKAIVDGVPLAIEQLQGSLANKVDKVAGKGLSTNDYDNASKAIVDGISLTVEQLQGSLANKVDKVAGKGLSTNDYDNAAKAIVDSVPLSIEQLQGSLANKVDKVAGKGLSTNDYDNAAKAIVDSVPLSIEQLQGSLATKASQATTYTKIEVNTLISAISTMNIEVVQALPTEDISTTTIYLVPKTSVFSNNSYDEYINVDGTTSGWEKIGDTEIDLSNYIQKSSTAGLVKNDGSIDTSTYAKTNELATVATSGSYDDLDDQPTIQSIEIGSVGTASGTETHYQRLRIDSIYTEIDGTKYMEQDVTTSTSATTIATFTNAAITSATVVDFYCSQWNLVPDDIVCNNGTCAVTLPVVDTAATVTVRIYLR